MAGPNVIAAYFGGTARNQVGSLSAATLAATETAIGVNTDSGTAVTAVLSIPTQTVIQGSYTPIDQSTNPAILNAGFNRTGYQFDSNPPYNSGSFDNGKPFLIRIAGLVTPVSNAGNTFTVKIYQGSAISGGTPTPTVIANSGAITGYESSTAAGSFVMETQCMWDSTLGKVNGQMWWIFNAATPAYNTWQKNTAVSAVVTASQLNFCASVQWGNAAAGIVAISEFSVSQL